MDHNQQSPDNDITPVIEDLLATKLKSAERRAKTYAADSLVEFSQFTGFEKVRKKQEEELSRMQQEKENQLARILALKRCRAIMLNSEATETSSQEVTSQNIFQDERVQALERIIVMEVHSYVTISVTLGRRKREIEYFSTRRFTAGG